MQHNSVTIDSYGNYFANCQDAKLCHEVSQLLDHFGLDQTTNEFDHALDDVFEHIDYSMLRSILDGIKAILRLAKTEGIKKIKDMKSLVNQVMQVSHEELEAEQQVILGKLGFTDLSDAQADHLISLNSYGFVALVRFAAAQLASESYMFSRLAMYMKCPLQDTQKAQLRKSLENMAAVAGPGRTLVDLNTFVEDALSANETQIGFEACTSLLSLHSFLTREKRCDTSNPVLTNLPRDITVRNYVGLHSLLRQIKLSFLYHSAPDEANPSNEEVNSASGNGSVDMDDWIWEELDEDSLHVQSKQPPKEERNSLWFAKDTSIKIPSSVAKSLSPENNNTLPDADTPSKENPILKADAYGSSSEEAKMIHWLHENHLPQSVCDRLLELGVRQLTDLAMLVKEHPEELAEFTFLDRTKLKKITKCHVH